MPATGETLRVEGLGDLQRAFRVADRSLARELRSELREVAEPVHVGAEARAVSSIRRIGLPWSRMRTGVTRHTVYVAPKQRGVKTRGRQSARRPNLGGLLMNQAMLPSLRAAEPLITFEMERMLGRVGRDWEGV